MSIPRIGTAIPQRRYQLGLVQAVLLGDIASEDGIDYRYICALVEDGAREPLLYIALLNGPQGPLVRIASAERTQDLTPSEPIAGLDGFWEQVLPLARRLLQLEDEMAVRLL